MSVEFNILTLLSLGTESITGRFPENECTNDENEIPIADGKTRNRCGQNGPHSSSTLIYERILNGNGRRSEDNSPEVCILKFHPIKTSL